MMSLRVLACAAPQFVEGQAGDMALSSADPASLHNACRHAARLAAQGRGAWGESNWNGSRRARRRSTLLLFDREEIAGRVAPLLDELRPNLVLIGAMSICMRGAVETATYVREVLGDEVCIVLGGRHPSETIYRDMASGGIGHHPASPLRLMEQGRVDQVFDVVLSGDGEYFISAIGELVAAEAGRGRSPRGVRHRLGELADTPGLWVAGTILDGTIRTVRSRGPAIDYHAMPAPSEMFGIGASFDVFDGAPTAHAFSDIGQGCIYDCTFCSERISVVGAPRQMSTSARRLFDQLAAARRVVDEDVSPASQASAFVEDSTFLGWNAALVRQFEEIVAREGLDVRIGGQVTVDQVVRSPALAGRLRRLGLEYVFIGLETPLPEVIGGLHKDIGRRHGSWMDRADKAMDILAEAGISVGVSLLFGLGEGERERRMLFAAIEKWRAAGLLTTVSMNWAVQHPLRDTVGAPQYDYLDWAIAPGPMLGLLRHFGEASERYPIAGGTVPGEHEVSDIVSAVESVMRTPELNPQ